MRYFMLLCFVFCLFCCKNDCIESDIDEVEYYDSLPIMDSLPVKICGNLGNFKMQVALVFDTTDRHRKIYLDSFREKNRWDRKGFNERICVEGTLIYRRGLSYKRWNYIKKGVRIPPPSYVYGDYPMLINYTWHYVE
jgi:hypothetical protein